MASLQVEGSMLETSCGSPHYACPEVIRVCYKSFSLVSTYIFRVKSTTVEKQTFGVVALSSTHY